MRETILSAIARQKLVVILRGLPREKLLDTLGALADGGVQLVEITFAADGRISDADTAKSIALAAEQFDGKLLVGAGTVLTEAQAALAKSAGAGFLLSPNTDPAVISKTRELGMVSIPGAFTPTEAQNANAAGADIVKLFPASVLGSGCIKALRAPLSQLSLMAVGGIDLDNMAAYLAAGACSVGIGSNIVSQTRVEEGDFEAIRALAKQYAACAKGEPYVPAH